jgi:hypothetical protein
MLVNGLREFWTNILGEVVGNPAAQRRLLALYAGLELTCTRVISDMNSAFTFRLTHDQMGLGPITDGGETVDEYASHE